jgi:hypothetical protein
MPASAWRHSLLVGAVSGVLLAVLATGAALLLRADEPPAGKERTALSCAPSLPPARETGTLRIHAVDTELPPDLHDELLIGAETALALWREWLDEQTLAPAPATLLFLDDAQDFAVLYDGPDVDGWTATGFYRIRSHEAVILYAEPWRHAARATAFHELSHLMTAWYLGPTPAWLNEGLAEHFETFTPGRTPAFGAYRGHLAVLAREGPLPLATLLGLSRRQFTIEEAARRYASAWSLIAFMLDDAQARVVLDTLLRGFYAGRCSGTDAQALQDRALARFPGGVEALDAAWRDWLGDTIRTGGQRGPGRAM